MISAPAISGTTSVDALAPGQRLTLLVVTPEASAMTAHAVLMAAGHRVIVADEKALQRQAGRSEGRPAAMTTGGRQR